MSETKNIYQKLASCEFPVFDKNSDNPFYKSSYASLDHIQKSVQPMLTANGLVLIQPIVDGRVKSVLVNIDNPNESIESSLDLPSNIEPQKIGSAITYYRRYTMASLLNLIISDEDDDGNATVPTKPQTAQQKPKVQEQKLVYRSDGSAWKDAVITFGKNQGKKLSDLNESQIKWYFDNVKDDAKNHSLYIALQDWNNRGNESDQSEPARYDSDGLPF